MSPSNDETKRSVKAPAERNEVRLGEMGAQVLPDLFVVSWLGMTKGRIDCHVYVLRSPSGLLLIDCGTPWGHESILRRCAYWGLDVKDIRTILLTHGHLDHALGGYLYKRRGVEILAHAVAARRAEAEWMDWRDAGDSSERHRVDGHLTDGDEILRCGYRVRAYHTPGHTLGCLTYLVEINGQRCLFSGDLVMNDARPGARTPEYTPSEIVKSLKRLHDVQFDHLCHGHSVLLNDRGELFREALRLADEGRW